MLNTTDLLTLVLYLSTDLSSSLWASPKGCSGALNVLWCIEDGIKPLNKTDPLGVFCGQLNIIGDEWAALSKSFPIISNVVDTDAVLHLLLLHPLCLKTGAKLSGTFRHQKKRARHQTSKLKSRATRCKNKLWAEDCNGRKRVFKNRQHLMIMLSYLNRVVSKSMKCKNRFVAARFCTIFTAHHHIIKSF